MTGYTTNVQSRWSKSPHEAFSKVPIEEQFRVNEQVCSTKVRNTLRGYNLNKPNIKLGYSVSVSSGVSGFVYKTEV